MVTITSVNVTTTHRPIAWIFPCSSESPSPYSLFSVLLEDHCHQNHHHHGPPHHLHQHHHQNWNRTISDFSFAFGTVLRSWLNLRQWGVWLCYFFSWTCFLLFWHSFSLKLHLTIVQIVSEKMRILGVLLNSLIGVFGHGYRAQPLFKFI